MLNRLNENNLVQESRGDFEVLKSEFAELKKMHETTLAELAKANREKVELVLSNQQLTQERDEAKKEARTDGLTKVSNRKYLDENLKAAFSNAKRHSRPLSVIMLDVDHFKLVNDLHTHAWGDTKLIQIADILKSAVRKEDCVARYGGEEFAIVLPETDINGALAVAEKVRKLVEALALEDRNKLVEEQKKAGKIPEEKLIGTISIGCTELTKAIHDSAKFLDNADKALIKSKKTGRNRITIYSEDQENEQATQSL